jgi:hypothetical protein
MTSLAAISLTAGHAAAPSAPAEVSTRRFQYMSLNALRAGWINSERPVLKHVALVADAVANLVRHVFVVVNNFAAIVGNATISVAHGIANVGHSLFGKRTVVIVEETPAVAALAHRSVDRPEEREAIVIRKQETSVVEVSVSDPEAVDLQDDGEGLPVAQSKAPWIVVGTGLGVVALAALAIYKGMVPTRVTNFFHRSPAAVKATPAAPAAVVAAAPAAVAVVAAPKPVSPAPVGKKA